MICMCSTKLCEFKFVSSHKNVGTGIPPRNCGVLPPVFKHHSSLSSCSSKREPVASTIIVVLVIVTSVSLSDLHLLCAAWINTAVCPFLREAGHGVSSADSLHPPLSSSSSISRWCAHGLQCSAREHNTRMHSG